MKPLAVLLALTLLVGCAVGGTLAWLTAKTSDVQNTFSPSDITIELKEHEYDATKDELKETETDVGVNNYKMIPGWTIPKDPWAKVSSDSEDCYLFVKVEELGGTTAYPFDDFIDYAVKTTGENHWIPLDATNHPGVYYKVIDTAAEKNVEHSIIGYTKDGVFVDDTVLVKNTVTKEMMVAVQNSKPELKFTAYAVQLWKTNKPAAGATEEQIEAAQFTPAQAWEKRPSTTSTPSNP